LEETAIAAGARFPVPSDDVIAVSIAIDAREDLDLCVRNGWAAAG